MRNSTENKESVDDLIKDRGQTQKGLPSKLLIGFLTCFALVSIIYIGKVPYGGQPQAGKVSERTMYAPFDFSYNAGIDLEKTEELKNAAALAVKDVYDIDSNIYDNAALNIKSFYAAIKDLKAAKGISLEEQVGRLKSLDKYSASDVNLRTFIQSAESEKTEQILLVRLAVFYSKGIIAPEEKENLLKQDKETVTLRNPSTKAEYGAEVKNLKTAEELKTQFATAFDEAAIDDKKLKSALTELALRIPAPNLKSNVVETSSRREKAIAAVPLQEKLIEVKKDELIIQRGERFTPFNVAKLEAIRAVSQHEEHFLLSVAGISLVVIALIIITSLYFAYYEPRIYANNRYIVLMAFIVVVLTAVGKAVDLSKGPAFLVPIAIGPTLVSLLLGARPAIVIAVATSLLAGLVLGQKFDATLIFLAGGIVGAYAVKGVRKRSQLFKAGVFIGIANSFCVVGLGILNNFEAQAILNDAAFFLINGMAVGAVTTGTLHLFESLSQITTNITLLELADPNNPLLKELILKAPGTYHHSLIVGNLAEAACDAIGANGLLARVGSYYHDIGKVEKAEYFAENQPIMESQHDKLAPSMSSLIIISHVKDGIDKAKKAKLSAALMDFIEQHHGTGLIYYFYQRALESVDDLTKIEEDGFRYPGPKPQTKETAIVHLADSVEAASRTLKNPTPANLEEMVRRIINNKFIDGQLDECELTLKDLNIIAAVFSKALTGVYHLRVQYPNEEEKSQRHI